MIPEVEDMPQLKWDSDLLNQISCSYALSNFQL